MTTLKKIVLSRCKGYATVSFCAIQINLSDLKIQLLTSNCCVLLCWSNYHSKYWLNLPMISLDFYLWVLWDFICLVMVRSCSFHGRLTEKNLSFNQIRIESYVDVLQGQIFVFSFEGSTINHGRNFSTNSNRFAINHTPPSLGPCSLPRILN